jgi:ribosomal protein S18 acetylase RimI-like enzyme
MAAEANLKKPVPAISPNIPATCCQIDRKSMNKISIRPYAESDFDAVDALWGEVFPEDPPWNRASAAIPKKMAFQPDLFFVALQGGRVIGTAMAGYDGHRGWLYSLAVLGNAQGTGLGAMLVRHVEQALKAVGCVKLNLQVRSSNSNVISFYERLGYAVEDRVSLGRNL